MKTLFIFLSALSFTIEAKADFECKDRVTAVYKGKFQAIPADAFFASIPMKAMYKKARTSYLKSFVLGEDESLSFENAGQMVKNNRVVGYLIQIGTGGDESSATFAFDVKGKILYGRLENQTPEYTWPCEK